MLLSNAQGELFTSILVTLKYYFENHQGGSKLPRCTEFQKSHAKQLRPSFLSSPSPHTISQAGPQTEKAKTCNDDLQPVVAAGIKH